MADSFGFMPLVVLVLIGIVVQYVHRVFHHSSLGDEKEEKTEGKRTRKRANSQGKKSRNSKSHSPRRRSSSRGSIHEAKVPKDTEAEAPEPATRSNRSRPRSLSFAAKSSSSSLLDDKITKANTELNSQTSSTTTTINKRPNARRGLNRRNTLGATEKSSVAPLTSANSTDRSAAKALGRKGTMPELGIGEKADDMDEQARKAAQEQALAMLAAMGGGSKGGAAGFATKSSLAPPMASSKSGSKVDGTARKRLQQAAQSIMLDISNFNVVVGKTEAINCRSASRKTAEQLETALREAEMAAMYGGTGSSFTWRVEPDKSAFNITVKTSVC
eukprot:TRINITY_DN5924_c0_g1_i2.p1 TRINITY_DN5924_c0_g1~~TRINITY_DN5924_c0_g1_i2.p1  ORF type:complete len:330 (+),score=62.80 TRINITY_DN5924_c0_g1_i2:210-1199(+)